MVSAGKAEAEAHDLSSPGWCRKVNLWIELSVEDERGGYMRQIVKPVG
jgi:hypothetical protein